VIKAYLIHLGQNLWKEPSGEKGPLSNYSYKMITEYSAWKRITDYVSECGFNTLIIDLAEGIQYKSHPELAAEGAWTTEFLKEELKRLRSIGLTPIPKLNFSATHDAWLKEYSHMLSTPTYYKVMKELIDEVALLFDTPSYFHLGMDEECFEFIDYQNKYGFTCVRQGKVFWDDINYMCKCVTDNGITPWLWGTKYWYEKEETIENMPKDALISSGFYDRLLNPEHFILFQYPAYESTFKFSENGFKQVPVCATYNTSINPDDFMATYKDLKGIKGFMAAPWFRTREIDVMKHFAEAKVFKCAFEKYNIR
jgi:hypothetical protein